MLCKRVPTYECLILLCACCCGCDSSFRIHGQFDSQKEGQLDFDSFSSIERYLEQVRKKVRKEIKKSRHELNPTMIPSPKYVM